MADHSIKRNRIPKKPDFKEKESRKPANAGGFGGIGGGEGVLTPRFARAVGKVTDRLRSFAASFIFPREGERGEAAARHYIVTAGRVLCGCFYAALLSRTQAVFSVYPFGLAFLASSGRGTPFYALASVIVCLAGGRVMSAAMCALILTARTLVCILLDTREEGIRRFPVYGEYIGCRVTVGCCAGFLCGVYSLFEGNFTGYALAGAFSLVALVPLGTWIFSVRWDMGARRELRESAAFLMLSLLIFSLRDISFFGIRTGAILAFFLTVGRAADQKKGVAVLTGLCCGLPLGLAQGGIYAFAGLFTSVLSGVSAVVGMLGSYLFVLLSEGYIGGYTVLLSCLPEASIGFCCATLWRRFGLWDKLSIFLLPSPENGAETGGVQTAENSMASLADAFESLSAMMRDLSDKNRRSHLLDTDGICDRACDAFCQNCRLCPICWEREGASSADAMGKLSSALASRGRVDVCDMPEYLRSRCLHAEELTREINRLASEATQEYLSEGTAWLAADYAAIAKILGSHLSSMREKEAIDADLTPALEALCRRRMYGIGRIAVYGKREKTVCAADIDLPSHTVSAAELQREMGKLCGCRFGPPVYHADGACMAFEMQTVSRFAVSAAAAGVPKKGERESGDVADSFLTPTGYFYGILCDGMGSGQEAARTGRVCASYLRNMLLHENPKELTVEMLNAVIRRRPGEVGSTVDLFELDTYTGDGCFIKSGAAPSFILRGKNVYRVQSKTVPLGLIEKVRAEKIRFRLKEGDLVVMVSDGVAEDGDDSRPIVERLCRRASDDPESVAAAVLSAAGDDAGDDMTVLVLSVRAV